MYNQIKIIFDCFLIIIIKCAVCVLGIQKWTFEKIRNSLCKCVGIIMIALLCTIIHYVDLLRIESFHRMRTSVKQCLVRRKWVDLRYLYFFCKLCRYVHLALRTFEMFLGQIFIVIVYFSISLYRYVQCNIAFSTFFSLKKCTYDFEKARKS